MSDTTIFSVITFLSAVGATINLVDGDWRFGVLGAISTMMWACYLVKHWSDK